MAACIAYDENGNVKMTFKWSGGAGVEEAMRSLVPSHLDSMDVDGDHPVYVAVDGWKVIGKKLVQRSRE